MLSRVKPSSAIAADPEWQPAHAAVEREDRRRERRDLERSPQLSVSGKDEWTGSGGRSDRRDRDRRATAMPEAQQQEPEERQRSPRRTRRARRRAASGRPRAGRARRRPAARRPPLVERLVVRDPLGVPGVIAGPARAARPRAGPRTSARAPRRSRRREARAGAPGSRARPASRPTGSRNAGRTARHARAASRTAMRPISALRTRTMVIGPARSLNPPSDQVSSRRRGPGTVLERISREPER